jgi:hypothetical protein
MITDPVHGTQWSGGLLSRPRTTSGASMLNRTRSDPFRIGSWPPGSDRPVSCLRRWGDEVRGGGRTPSRYSFVGLLCGGSSKDELEHSGAIAIIATPLICTGAQTESNVRAAATLNNLATFSIQGDAKSSQPAVSLGWLNVPTRYHFRAVRGAATFACCLASVSAGTT